MFLPDELAVQIKAAKAKYIITHKEIEKTAAEAASLCSVERKFIYTMGHGVDSVEGLKSIEYVSYAAGAELARMLTVMWPCLVSWSGTSCSRSRVARRASPR
jgi:hypothetical protein